MHGHHADEHRHVRHGLERLDRVREGLPPGAEHGLRERPELPLHVLVRGGALAGVPGGLQELLGPRRAVLHGDRDVLDAFQRKLPRVLFLLLHVNALGHVQDLRVLHHRGLVEEVVGLDPAVLQAIRQGEGDAVDRLQRRLGLAVAEVQRLLEAGYLDVLHVLDRHLLLPLPHVEAGERGVRPPARGPLLVVGVLDLDARA
mmetsp:Transcript_37990/g.107340  ORF Transcript_37990/g.107340 Transcript_37990/m.107340 type:complete len:201 (+) Transcript_37990:163-765(+)